MDRFLAGCWKKIKDKARPENPPKKEKRKETKKCISRNI